MDSRPTFFEFMEAEIIRQGEAMTTDPEVIRAEFQRFYDFVADSDVALVDAYHFTENVRAGMLARGIEDQPTPIPNDRPAIVDLVIQDMVERKAIGIERYGTPLQAHNGRDAMVDAYQEALDLCMYLRQAIEERRVPRSIP